MPTHHPDHADHEPPSLPPADEDADNLDPSERNREVRRERRRREDMVVDGMAYRNVMNALERKRRKQ